MGKRTTAIALCAALAIGSTLAAYAAGSADSRTVLRLSLKADKQAWETLKLKGGEDIAKAPDTLRASADYGVLLPYMAQMVGWDSNGEAVYRYALVDRNGDAVTAAVYESVEQQEQDSGSVWILTETDGTANQVTVAALDGSWVVGPYEAEVLVDGDRVFIRRAGQEWTTVYSMKGDKLGRVLGTVSSCSDDVIVSHTDNGDTLSWYFSDAENCDQLGTRKAQQVGAFDKGYAPVILSGVSCAFTDAQGKLTALPDIVELDAVQEGYALAKDASGKYGVIEADTGKAAVKFQYSKGSLCSEDAPVYQLWTSDTECVVINARSRQKVALPRELNGKELTALPENYYLYTADDGKMVVFDDMKTIRLDAGVSFRSLAEDTLAVLGDDYYQLIDLEEGRVSDKYRGRLAEQCVGAACNRKTFSVQNSTSNLWGIANIQGKQVLPMRYDSIVPVDSRHYMVRIGSWSGIVNNKGKWLVCAQIGAAD